MTPKARLSRLTIGLGDDFFYVARAFTAMGESRRDVAKTLRISVSSVQRLLALGLPSRRIRKRRAASPQNKKRARRRKLVVKVLKTFKQEGKMASLAHLRKRIQREHHITVSCETVRRDLMASGLVAKVRPRIPRQLPGDFDKRVAFAHKELALRRDERKSTIFTDEKRFSDSDFSNRFEWLPASQQPGRRINARWGSTVLVWGAIGVGKRFLRVFSSTERLNADTYRRRVLIPFFAHARQQGWHKCMRFQQDGAACHRARPVQAYLLNTRVPLVTEWPPRSPHLSPIENLWALVQKAVSDRILSESRAGQGVSVARLTEIVKEEWDSFDQNIIDSLCLSYESRLQREIDRAEA